MGNKNDTVQSETHHKQHNSDTAQFSGVTQDRVGSTDHRSLHAETKR